MTDVEVNSKGVMVNISVVTVCFNAVKTIGESLDSVGRQSHPNVEHIVVDGASTDGTLSIVEKHRDKLAAIISEPDRGLYDAMNKGIGLATGDVIGFLNADDVYVDSQVLSHVAEAFRGDDIDACYADVVFVRPDDTNRVVRYVKSRPFIEGLFEKGWMPPHPTLFVRKTIYERLGGFDIEFTRQADFDLALRFLGLHKIRSVYVPDIWVRMRTGGLSNNSLPGILKGNLEAYRICKKHNLPVTPLFIATKIFSRIPQFLSGPRYMTTISYLLL